MKLLRLLKQDSLGYNGATNHHHHDRQCHQLQTALARVLDELGPKRPGEIDPYVALAVDPPLKIDNCHQLIAERVSDVFLQI